MSDGPTGRLTFFVGVGKAVLDRVAHGRRVLGSDSPTARPNRAAGPRPTAMRDGTPEGAWRADGPYATSETIPVMIAALKADPVACYRKATSSLPVTVSRPSPARMCHQDRGAACAQSLSIAPRAR